MTDEAVDQVRETFAEIYQSLEEEGTFDNATQQVDELRDQLIDGIAALEAIATTGGVSRQMIASFEQFLPDDVPLNSFTRTETQTNLDVATATLENRNWGMIAAIAAAIASIIGTILRVVMAAKGGSATGGKSLQEAGERVRENQRKLTPAVRSKVDELIKSIEDDLADKVTAYDYEVIMKLEPLTRAMMEVGEPIYKSLLPTYKRSLDRVKDILKRHPDESVILAMETERETLNVICEKISRQLKEVNDRSLQKDDDLSQIKRCDQLIRLAKVQIEEAMQTPSKRKVDVIDFANLASTRGVGLGAQVKDVDLHQSKTIERDLKDAQSTCETLVKLKVEPVLSRKAQEMRLNEVSILAQIHAAVNGYLRDAMQVSSLLGTYSVFRAKMFSKGLPRHFVDAFNRFDRELTRIKKEETE